MKKRFKRGHLYILLTLVVVPILLTGTVFGFASYHKNVKKPIAVALIPQVTIFSPTPSPTSSPSATPTPTLAPPAPVGYCLSVPVIFYHHIEPMEQAKKKGHGQLTVDSEIFTQQMAYLASHGYTSYSAEQLVDALIGHSSLPGKPVVVTIDDGYSDTFQYAYSIAKQYGIKLSVMISTGLLENSGYMSWGNLKDMVGSGTVFAYDHTWSHYSLPKGSYDKEETEIMTGKRQLEDQLGGKNLILTYPYGVPGKSSVAILKKNGFKAAFTTIPSFLQCDGFIYNLHRNRIGNASLSSYGL